MADHPDALPPALTARYTVVETLGEGAMGVVYRAVQVSLDRPVALKVIRRQMFSDYAKGRFLQEARLAARVNHPNVVQVHEAGEADGIPFIAFEYVNGQSLRHELTRGPLEASVAFQHACGVARGLAAAHEQGVIHRDVKPENILIARNGEAKIADFGISRPVQDDNPGLTATGVILGSPLYMSPEQAGNRTLTGATDQYSLGVVVFEMLVGRPPFDGSAAEILAHHLRDPVVLPPEVRASVPVPAVTVLETLLRKDPAGRFASAAELVARLEEVLARWRGPRKTTIPTPRPRVPVFARADPPPPEELPRPASRSGARARPREGAQTGANTRMQTRVPRELPVFEEEPLPAPIRAALVALIAVSLAVISYWMGKNAQAPRARPELAETPPRRQDATWKPGTVIGNVATKCLHVVGEEEPGSLPARENGRVFESVEDGERAGYRRCHVSGQR